MKFQTNKKGIPHVRIFITAFTYTYNDDVYIKYNAWLIHTTKQKKETKAEEN